MVKITCIVRVYFKILLICFFLCFQQRFDSEKAGDREVSYISDLVRACITYGKASGQVMKFQISPNYSIQLMTEVNFIFCAQGL